MTSFYRDDVPWLYTMAVELYRTSLSDDREAEGRAYHAFRRAVESLDDGPFLHEMLGTSRKEIYMLVRELPRILDRFAPRFETVADPGKPTSDSADA
jgi:hypothetical protein